MTKQEGNRTEITQVHVSVLNTVPIIHAHSPREHAHALRFSVHCSTICRGDRDSVWVTMVGLTSRQFSLSNYEIQICSLECLQISAHVHQPLNEVCTSREDFTSTIPKSLQIWTPMVHLLNEPCSKIEICVQKHHPF